MIIERTAICPVGWLWNHQKLDDYETIKDLQNQKEKLGNFYTLGTTAKNVISADENVMSIIPSLTDEELI